VYDQGYEAVVKPEFNNLLLVQSDIPRKVAGISPMTIPQISCQNDCFMGQLSRLGRQLKHLIPLTKYTEKH